MKLREMPPKWHGLHIALVMIAMFIIGIAVGIISTMRPVRGADLPIPKRSESTGRVPKQAPFSIGKTPIPEEPRACTQQLKEMKLCL